MSILSDAVKPVTTTGPLLMERFRCAEDLGAFEVTGQLSHESGYFQLGPDVICYGQCSSGAPTKLVTADLHDVESYINADRAPVQLPFNAAKVVDNLRLERYFPYWTERKTSLLGNNAVRNMYYMVRPLMPVHVRRHLQKLYFRGWDKNAFPAWPVDSTVDRLYEKLLIASMRSQQLTRVPFVWFWPEGARSCTMMTHDVETASGVSFCPQLMDMNDSFGIKSSFQIVPEKRYPVSAALLDSIRKRGFEINIHDLNHDGHLMRDRTEFLRSAKRINNYAQEYGAQGFRSAVLYRNVDWYDSLDFSYDMSLPTVAHLDPQQGGCCTVMPFFIGKILELPLTTTQDYSLFFILNDYSTKLWEKQIALIRQSHGLISFNIHPDYLVGQSARRIYLALLRQLADLRSQGETWIAQPSAVSAWWRQRSEMKVVKGGGAWRVEGAGNERARVAYAVLEDAKLSYDLDSDGIGH